MSRLLSLALMVMLLTACGIKNSRITVPAQCNAMCFEHCVGEDGDTGIRVTTSPDDPAGWDHLGGDIVPTLADRLRVCDARRESCAQCLRRLETQQVIHL